MKITFGQLLALIIVVVLGWCNGASAQQYFSNTGGAQPWDNSTLNWGAASGGPYDEAWTGGQAVFEGTAGTVSLSTVSASNITFSVGGYTLADGTLTLTGTGPAVVADSGATISASIAGVAGLTKGGTGGTLTLGGANSYSGGTTVNAGTLAVSADNQLGASGEGITLDGGTLRNTDTLHTITRPMMLGSAGGAMNLGTYLNYNGPITGGTGLTVGGSDFIMSPPSANDIGAFTLTSSRLFVNNANAIANNCSLAITGGGRLVFQGGGTPTAPANTMTFASGCGLCIRSSASADLTVSTTNVTFPASGSIIFNKDDQPTRGVTVNGDWPTLTGGLSLQVGGYSTAVGPVTVNGSFSGSGGLSKTSTGTLVLTSPSSFTGGMTVEAGKVRLGDDEAMGASTGLLTVKNGGTLDLAGFNPHVTGLTDTLGFGTTGTGMITNSGDEATLTITRASKAFAGAIGGPVNLVIPTGGSGYQILSGNSTYTGTTTIYGSLETWGTNALGSTESGTVITNGAGLSMKGNSEPMIYAAEPLTFYGSSSFSLNTDSALKNPVWTGPVTLAEGATMNVRGGNVDGSITIPSVISGTGALNKYNTTLTLMLSGDNDYSGGTTISDGTLKLGSATALGTGPVTIDSGLLDLNGTSPAIGSLSGTSAGAIVDNSAGSGTTTLTVNQTANTTCSSSISNGVEKTLGLTLEGTGVLTLDAINTYEGPTTVNGGTLKPGMLAALPGAVTVTSGGTLDINALSIESVSPLVTIAGAGAPGQTGALANTGSGSEARVQNLTLTDDATIGTTGTKLNVYGTLDGGGHVLTVAGSGETNVRIGNNMINLDGVIVNSGLLRLESSQPWAGTYTVNPGGRLDSYGNRTEAGSVVLNGGQLANGGGGTGIWLGAVTVGAISIVDAAGGNMVLSNAVTGTGSLIKNGGNTLTLAGACDFTGTLGVTNGTVTVSGSLACAGGKVAAGATLNGDGTLHARVVNGLPATLTVEGTLDASALTLDLDVTGSPKGSPHTLIDAADGTLTGRFADVFDVPAGYAVIYEDQKVLLVCAGTQILLH